jgi:hypothetical protein
MDELATRFLAAYAAGGEPDGGWKYGKALQQARLDYSPESLGRLDALLTQIRERAKPTRAELDTPQGRNFESLVVFYLVELARRISHARLHWLDFAAARHALPPGMPLVESASTRLVVDAPANAVLFKPLAWLEGRLLDDGKPVAPADYLAGMLAQLRQEGPADWSSAMFAVGTLGSWHMMTAAQGHGVWPSLITARAPSTLRHLERGDLQRAVEHCRRLLNRNPDHEAWQVSSYPGYAEHGAQRLDAVIVLAATHGDEPMLLAMAFPYRPAVEGRRFEILQPTLVESNLSVETVGKLVGALERGIRHLRWDAGGGWDELYRA